MTPITHVRYVALGVPNLDAEVSFFVGPWGLHEVVRKDGSVFCGASSSEEPFIVRLRQTEKRQTDLVALGVSTRPSVDELHARASAKGARIASAPGALSTPGGGYGFRLFDLEGRLIEISSDVTKTAPEMPADRAALPIGIAHAVFHTPNLNDTVAWYADVLGMRVSDWLDGFMCFMRGGTTKHHCLAFLTGPPTLNHVAFEMRDMDAVMRGLGRMMKNDVKLNWGPGRHTLGDNVFSYFNSPSGNVYEYTAEVEHIPDDWTPRVLPRRADIIDQWETGRIAGPAVYPQLEPDPALWKSDAL